MWIAANEAQTASRSKDIESERRIGRSRAVAAFEGTEEEKRRFFAQVATQIQRRIDLLCCLPFSQLSGLSLAKETKDIGQKEKIDTKVSSQ
jgi:hypothetical protein